MVQVRLFPNSARPGIGLRPRRESDRPLLPRHARNCPVLEAGSAVGFLVYPPLAPEESYSLEYKGEGQYRFGYYVNPSGASWELIFTVTVVLPVGGIGAFREEVSFAMRDPKLSR